MLNADAGFLSGFKDEVRNLAAYLTGYAALETCQ